ncbi:hypothetical protein V8C86DRAFT_3023298 [Haematococcus lacustris]
MAEYNHDVRDFSIGPFPEFVASCAEHLHVRDLCSAARVCRSWRGIIECLWEQRAKRWTHESDRWTAMKTGDRWRQLYAERHMMDMAVLRAVRDMNWPHKREQGMARLRSLGLDCLDVLLSVCHHATGCMDTGRRYWALQAVTAVQTHQAAQRMEALCRASPDPQHVERGPACIALAHYPLQPHMPDQLTAQLNLIGQEACRRIHSAGCWVQRPQLPLSTLTSTAGQAGQGQVAQHPAVKALQVVNHLVFGPRHPDHPVGPLLSPGRGAAEGLAGQRERGDAAGGGCLHDLQHSSMCFIPPEGYGLGLQGNSQDYHNPANSLLPEVLSSGLGLPISLAVLHMAIARRAGLAVDLMNMPLRIYSRLAIRDSHPPPAGLQPGLGAEGAEGCGGRRGHAPLHPSQSFGAGLVEAAPHTTAAATAPAATAAAATATGAEAGAAAGTGASAAGTRRVAAGQASAAAGRGVTGARDIAGPAEESVTVSGGRQAAGVDNGGDEVVFVDVFGGGGIMDLEDLRDAMQEMGVLVTPSHLLPMTTEAICTRMCANLANLYNSQRDHAHLRMVLELATAINPQMRDGWRHRLQAALAVQDFNDAEAAVAGLQSQLTGSGVEGMRLRLMQTNVQQSRRLFRVGDVVRHKRYHYRGVVYDWDPSCAMDEAWVTQMGVDALPGGRQQPFYHVLVDARDRPFRNTYTAHVNLELLQEPHAAHAQDAGDTSVRRAARGASPPGPGVEHPDIGLYFEGLPPACKCSVRQPRTYVLNPFMRYKFGDVAQHYACSHAARPKPIFAYVDAMPYVPNASIAPRS